MKSTEFVDIPHSVEKLSEESDDLELTHFFSDQLLERSSRAELDEEIKTRLIFFVSIVAHNIRMVDLCEFSHHIDFPFVFRDLFQHLLLHKLDSNNPVFTEVVTLVDDTVITLAERLGTIDVEVIINLLHALHLSNSKILNINQN